MFLEEADFDDNDIGDPFSRRSSSTMKRDDKSIDDKDSSFDADGNDGSSRARMLAQQRDIQLKRRSSAAQSGNMIRSIDLGPSSSRGPTNQFTPAVRQFSAPKSINDASADASPDAKSEFSRPLRASIPPTNDSNNNSNGGRRESMSRYGRDDSDEEVEVRRSNRDKGGGDRDRDGNSKERSKRMESRRRFDDDDEEEDDRYDRRGGGNDKWGGNNNSNSNNNSNNRSNNRSREESKRDKGSRNKHQSDWEGGAKLDNEGGARFRNSENTRETAVRTIEPLNLSDMRRFLTNPVPKGCGVVQCYIRRNKNGTNKIFPVYSLYLKEGDRFLMTSKKRPNNKTSNYLISMGEGDMNRDGVNYLGKLRSNFVGTEFQVFDNGISPKEAGVDDNNNSIRKELGSVIYAANVLGSRGPRKMQVAIPAVDENNQITTWRQGSSEQEDILGRIRDRNLRDLVYLINKPPRWNEQVGAYVLNFNGRVTMASVKNFQLVDPDEHNTVVLQFGRVGKDDFTMDLQWPMSPLQAFAITLSSFDSKIACD